ncbi:MAG TPA: VOC family protein [Terriglobia bacterium]|nr:VOC family protein [Terriglobia bacterium]
MKTSASHSSIAGIQQIGIGVASAPAAFAWYRRHFGFDVRIFEDVAEAVHMRKYTGGNVERRHAILALNMAGGGGLEIWQLVSRPPKASGTRIELGDCGIFAAKLKTIDVQRAFDFMRSSGTVLSAEIASDPAGIAHFFVQDPYGNIFEVAESRTQFARTTHPVGGIAGVTIGVTDMDRSVAFYRDTLGYDRLLFDHCSAFPDFGPLPGGNSNVRWVRLARTAPSEGPFSRLLGPAEIDLVQVRGRAPKRIYDGRCWGDLGFIHLCFDVRGMDFIHERSARLGSPPTVDTANSFDMGEASGRLSCVEDPDTTLIELVETHKVPILKKLGWSIDLRKRPPDRALPDWILRGLAFNRVKD